MHKNKKNSITLALAALTFVIFLIGAASININGQQVLNPFSYASSNPVSDPVSSPVSNQKEPFKDILAAKGIEPGEYKDIKIIVDKSDKTLTLYLKDIKLKSYHVEFGDGGSGDKQVSGDHKTPEGQFYVCEKSILSPPDQYLGTRWMRLSYPNVEDADRGLGAGLIDRQVHEDIVSAFNSGSIPPQRTALGGGVGIHGGDVPEFQDNWTWGCIGLTNADVEDFFDYISVGTPVSVQK